MFKVPEDLRVTTGKFGTTKGSGNNGMFRLPQKGKPLEPSFMIIASDGEGWDHVSVSLPTRCPTWEEMCTIKQRFWGPEDCAVQYHPAESEYVNNHQFCLHLFRPQNMVVPTPPPYMVGVLGLTLS